MGGAGGDDVDARRADVFVFICSVDELLALVIQCGDVVILVSLSPQLTWPNKPKTIQPAFPDK